VRRLINPFSPFAFLTSEPALHFLVGPSFAIARSLSSGLLILPSAIPEFDTHEKKPKLV
jgi:hypothetical protein